MVFQNCQNFWADGLINNIVCQCPDRRPLKLPHDMTEWIARWFFFIVLVHVVALVVSHFHEAGSLSSFGALCLISNKWWWLWHTLIRCSILLYQVQKYLTRYHVDGMVKVPFMDVTELTKARENLENRKDEDAVSKSRNAKQVQFLSDEIHNTDIAGKFEDLRIVVLSNMRIYGLGVLANIILTTLYQVLGFRIFQHLVVILAVYTAIRAWKVTALTDLPGFPPLYSCLARRVKLGFL